MADLNSTIVRGKLRVTQDEYISGSLNVTGTITQNGTAVSLSGHTHDGRYIRTAGSAADVSAMTWGTLTAANGYTILSHVASSDGGDWGMVNKGGQIFMQLDGYYYQNEGRYRVVDTNDLSGYLPLSGGVIDAGGARTPLILKNGMGNYREGIRIVPTGNWSGILLGGKDVTEASGTSANSWVIGNENGQLNITRNGSTDQGSATFKCTSNAWTIGRKTLTVETTNTWLTPSKLMLGRENADVHANEAVIGVTNGNLHLDAYDGCGVYLNHYQTTKNADCKVYFNGSAYYINGSGYFNGSCNYANSAGTATDSTKVAKSGDTMTGALTINGVADTGAYSQGGYNKAYSNIILHGDSTYGVSGITFKSYAGDTNINNPSDVAFIQYHAHGVTPAAYNTTPTEASSGERGRLVIGVGNDADNDSSDVGEQVWLQTAGAHDLKHYVVNTGYEILDTGNYSNLTRILGSTATSATNKITINGKLIVNPTYDSNNSFNEGVRINRASNNWAEVLLGAESGTTSANSTGAWLVGRRGEAGSKSGAAGDFTIEYGTSTGTGLTLYANGNAPSWNGTALSLNGHTHSYLPLSGGTLSGMIIGDTGHGVTIRSNNTGFYNEGLRIYKNTSNNWAALALVNADDPTYSFGIAVNDTTDKCYYEYRKNGTTTQTHFPQKNGTLALAGEAQPASDVYDWAKASTKPSYSFDEISSRSQAYIGWGGPALSSSASPIEVATLDDLRGNKFAFMSAASVVVQYSRDGGSTWTDYGASDNSRRELVTLSNSFTIGCRTGGSNTVNDKLRVILNSSYAGGNVYCNLRRLLINLSTSGSGGCTVKVEYRTIGDYKNNNDTWNDAGTYGVGGWSGWNSIPFSGAFGGSSDQTYQTAQIRLTFGVTSVSSTYNNLCIYSIRGIGFPLWSSPSTMASINHLYSYDIGQNATFPAALTAKSLNTSAGSGNNYAVHLGPMDGSWDNGSYPTLRSDASTHKWVMHVNPHIVDYSTMACNSTVAGSCIRMENRGKGYTDLYADRNYNFGIYQENKGTLLTVNATQTKITIPDHSSTGTGPALLVENNHSSGGGINTKAAVFRNMYGTHDYGSVAEFNVATTSGDKPSIRFSTGAIDSLSSGSTSWSIGYCTGSDYKFRINKNHGYDDWGTNAITIDTDLNTVFGGSLTIPAACPLSFTSTGTGTYNHGAIYNESSGITIETPRASDASDAAATPLMVKTRGGQWAHLRSGRISAIPGDANTVLNTQARVTAGTSAIFGVEDNAAISSTVTSPYTNMIQLCAGTGGATKGNCIGFHNPSISSSTIGYYNTDADRGIFRFSTDDTHAKVLIDCGRIELTSKTFDSTSMNGMNGIFRNGDAMWLASSDRKFGLTYAGVDGYIFSYAQTNATYNITLPGGSGTLALVGDNNHTHDYLPLGGGNMTGSINFTNTNKSIYEIGSGSTHTTPSGKSVSANSNDSGAIGVNVTAGSDTGLYMFGSDCCIMCNSGDSGLLKIFDEDTAYSGSSYTVSGSSVGSNGLMFYVNGSGQATAVSFYATSDRRLKDNIRKSDLDCLALINSLQLKEFNFKTQKNKDDKYFGVIAQELRKILPDKYKSTIVNKADDKTGVLSVNEGKFQYITAGAVQQLSKKVEKLEKENKELKDIIKEMNKKLDKLLAGR